MQEAAAPNFVLTLLAACSSAVPAAGQEGEAKVSKQLTGLLQTKAMTLEELQLLYNYKFGFSIDDAVKFAGFNGKAEEFLAEQKCFSIQEGSISVKPVDIVVTIDEAPTFDEPAKMDEPVATCNVVPVDGEAALAQRALPTVQDFGFEPASRAIPTVQDFGFEPTVDGEAASPQRALPTVKDFGFEPATDERALPTILDFGFKTVDDDASITSITDTDSTTDSEGSELDDDFDDIDIPRWHSIGNRLVAALGKGDDVDADGLRWKVLGGRIATAFSSDGSDSEDEDIEDDGANIVAWHDIGNRVMTACKRSDGTDITGLDA